MSSDTHLELAGEFPPVTAAEWRAAVNRVLAGRDSDLSERELDSRFERQLVTDTYDGISVQPLYTSRDLPPDALRDGVPGFWPYVRGSTPSVSSCAGWDVRQPIELDTVASSGSSGALDQLERGATSLLLRSDAAGLPQPAAVDPAMLDVALEGVFLDLVTIALDCSLGISGATALLELWRRRAVDPAAARGVLGLDPIGTAASLGRSLEDAELEETAALAIDCAQHWPEARSLVVDATRYHEAGASDIQELSCATATGIAYVRNLVDAGLDVPQALGQLEFRLSATADQFSTIAKLRAARRMWARVAEVLGSPERSGQRQHVLTSQAMLSRYDASVNLLRNTTACFAAGAGGADAITVEAHDLLVSAAGPSDLGRRMARNTQLLLLEETHLNQVIDPGGGSWYVEWLTDAMAKAAWSWFQEIEDAGGMASALASGMVGTGVDETWAIRSRNLARRTDTIVGVSDFPDVGDRSIGPAGTARSAGLPRRRYAQDFEALRSRTDEHERLTGDRPTVLLVRLGPASAYTARSTFAKSFFEIAGMHTCEHDLVLSLDADPKRDDLAEAIGRSGATLACVCSSDPFYSERGQGALGRLAASGLRRVYAATRPGQLGDALIAAGADELIYAGCDALEALGRALETLGIP